MAQRHNFRNLKIYNRGMDLAVAVYQLSKSWPKEEQYGLTNQVRRSAFSIPSNIAEGSAKSSNRDFKRYLEIALGSAFEAETQLRIAERLEMGDYQKINDLILEIQEEQRMLGSLIDKLKAKLSDSTKNG